MIGQYLPILAMLVLAVVFGALSRVASQLLAPRMSTAAKSSPYECGIVPSREPAQRFPVKFYLIAMIFIVFDIEIIFLFPYATVYDQVGTFGFVALLIFAFALFESFVYLIGNGALDWGPAKKQRPAEMITPVRTTRTTIRKVGTEGRGERVAVADAPGEAA